MEAIKDIHKKKICEADTQSGIIVHQYGKNEIWIRLLVGGEVMIKTQNSRTIIFRDSLLRMQVTRMGLESTG